MSIYNKDIPIYKRYDLKENIKVIYDYRLLRMYFLDI